MLGKFFNLSLYVFLAIVLVSCSKEDKSGINKGNRMNYTVKRAFQAVNLSSKWETGQWKQANILELKNYMGDKPEHFPKTQAKLLYDDENLYVFFRVEDRYVRAIADKTHGKVWQDSCVEFFFTPDTALENMVHPVNE